MKVSDLMTKQVASVRSDEPLSNAAKLMWDCDCGALPVVGKDGRVVGMVTDRDICMAAWFKDQSPSSLVVSDAMSQTVVYCAPDDSIAYSEGLMRSKQVRRVPVLDSKQRLLGILSLADIVRIGAKKSGRKPAELGSEQIAQTLAQIVEPTMALAPPQ